MVYNKLGDHNKSISLLERVIEEKEALYGSQHPSLAIPMVRLTSAYYYNGDMKKVEQNRERFIALNLPPPLISLKGEINYVVIIRLILPQIKDIILPMQVVLILSTIIIIVQIFF